MPTPQTIEPFFLERFKKIRELLDILAALRDLTEPLTTADGLRQTIELLARGGKGGGGKGVSDGLNLCQ